MKEVLSGIDYVKNVDGFDKFTFESGFWQGGSRRKNNNRH